jgi:hypothetical protein
MESQEALVREVFPVVNPHTRPGDKECAAGNCDKKHTPIVSKAQQGFFGAELARRKAGKKGKMKGISETKLAAHLKESKGKKLPQKTT